MSVPYHIELFKSSRVRLLINYSGIKGDVADENIALHIYAIDEQGMPVFTEKIGIQEIRALHKHLDSITVVKNGSKKSAKFIETNDEINLILDRLHDSDLQTILALLSKFKSEEKIRGLLESLSNLEIENLHGAFHRNLILSELNNIEKLIGLEADGNIVEKIKECDSLKKYAAGQPEKIFQNWIESNLWIFGVSYLRKHDERKIALFSEGDILMESAGGYLDLIELKRPRYELLRFDPRHNCYYPHPDLSQVIGQALFYLQKLNEYKLILEREYSTKVIMPRVKIIAGRSNGFGEEQRDCIRMLNSGLNFIEIMTYDDLILNGRLLLKAHERYGLGREG